jgi:hypothetical protein
MEGKWFSFSVSFTNFVLVILATCYNLLQLSIRLGQW